MSNPDYVVRLLDDAKKNSGSDAKTAKLLDVSITVISSWRNGYRTCSPEDVAQLADVAGMDGEKWLIRATLAKHEGTAKGDRLMKVLGKALAVTGVVASNGANAQPTFLIDVLDYFIRCILLLNRKRHWPRTF